MHIKIDNLFLEEGLPEEEKEADELGGLFTVLRKKSEKSKTSRVVKDGLDCSRISQEVTATDVDEVIPVQGML